MSAHGGADRHQHSRSICEAAARARCEATERERPQTWGGVLPMPSWRGAQQWPRRRAACGHPWPTRNICPQWMQGGRAWNGGRSTTCARNAGRKQGAGGGSGGPGRCGAGLAGGDAFTRQAYDAEPPTDACRRCGVIMRDRARGARYAFCPLPVAAGQVDGALGVQGISYSIIGRGRQDRSAKASAKLQCSLATLPPAYRGLGGTLKCCVGRPSTHDIAPEEEGRSAGGSISRARLGNHVGPSQTGSAHGEELARLPEAQRLCRTVHAVGQLIFR